MLIRACTVWKLFNGLWRQYKFGAAWANYVELVIFDLLCQGIELSERRGRKSKPSPGCYWRRSVMTSLSIGERSNKLKLELEITSKMCWIVLLSPTTVQPGTTFLMLFTNMCTRLIEVKLRVFTIDSSIDQPQKQRATNWQALFAINCARAL